MYAVVNKRSKIRPAIDGVGNNYCSATSIEEICTVNTILNAANNYQTTPNTYAEVTEIVSDCNKKLEKTNKMKQRINHKCYLLHCLVIFITAVVVITLAVVAALVVIADLKSELNSVQNHNNVGQNNQKKLDQLQADFVSFYSNISDLLFGIS